MFYFNHLLRVVDVEFQYGIRGKVKLQQRYYSCKNRGSWQIYFKQPLTHRSRFNFNNTQFVRRNFRKSDLS